MVRLLHPTPSMAHNCAHDRFNSAPFLEWPRSLVRLCKIFFFLRQLFIFFNEDDRFANAFFMEKEILRVMRTSNADLICVMFQEKKKIILGIRCS